MLRLMAIVGLALLVLVVAARWLPQGHRVWIDDLPDPDDLARYGGEPDFGDPTGIVDENADAPPSPAAAANDDENADLPEDDRLAE